MEAVSYKRFLESSTLKVLVRVFRIGWDMAVWVNREAMARVSLNCLVGQQ